MRCSLAIRFNSSLAKNKRKRRGTANDGLNLSPGLTCRAPTEQFGYPVSGSIPTIIRTFKSSVSYNFHLTRDFRDTTIWQGSCLINCLPFPIAFQPNKGILRVLSEKHAQGAEDARQTRAKGGVGRLHNYSIIFVHYHPYNRRETMTGCTPSYLPILSVLPTGLKLLRRPWRCQGSYPKTAPQVRITMTGI